MSQNISDLASLIGVQAVAVVGIALILISTAWKGFERVYLHLSSQEKRTIFTGSVIPFVIIFLLLGAFTLSGVYAPSMVAAALILTMILISAGLVIATPIIIILRKRRMIKQPQKSDDVCMLYLFALLFLASCILCSVGALISVTSTMLNIHVGPYESENFEWGRWLMWNGTFLFGSGIIEMGFAYLMDKIRQWKAAGC
jgi:hypothetical protein